MFKILAEYIKNKEINIENITYAEGIFDVC
jgi:hypothetical protein